jgi:hypothetical protein
VKASKLLAARAWPWVLGLAVMWPLLKPGFVLSYDMVFVPDLAFRSDFLGLGSGLPRAVPSDALVSLLDELVPGQVLEKVLLLGALVLAGSGARRLVPSDNLTAQLAATSLYLWNPYVAERLGIGHWPLLLAYASLPWLFDAARRARAGESAMPAIVLWLALAALSPAGGVIGGVFALVCVVGRGRAARKRSLLVALGALAVNAPWIVAGALHGSGALSDPHGVEAFAARGEGLLSLPLTVLGLGGIWNAEVVPASRDGWPAVAALVTTVGLSAVAVMGWRKLVPRRDRQALLASAVLGLLVALLGALLPQVVVWLGSTVPGAGLLRDGSRYLALLAPLAACLFGLGVSAVADLVRAHAVRVTVATTLVLLPIALLPDLGFGLAGQLRTVQFPAEYTSARQAIDDRLIHRGDGDLLVLPFSSYRLPTWNHGRRTLDPLGRFMTPNYLANDTLVVSGVTVAGEDERARRVAGLLEQRESTQTLARQLSREGIAWVLLDKDAQAMVPGSVPTARFDGFPVIHDGKRLIVWELPGAHRADSSPADEAAVWSAWAVAGASLLGCAGLLMARLVRSRRYRSRS